VPPWSLNNLITLMSLTDLTMKTLMPFIESILEPKALICTKYFSNVLYYLIKLLENADAFNTDLNLSVLHSMNFFF